MSTTLQQQIRQRLANKHISANALEKRAGLKASAVQNILQGKSKRPRADILQAIAQELDCTVMDLLGENSSIQTSKKFTKESTANPLDYSLYIETMEVLNEICNKKSLHFSKEQILHIADEAYNYCVTGGLKKIDLHFVEWLIERYQSILKNHS